MSTLNEKGTAYIDRGGEERPRVTGVTSAYGGPGGLPLWASRLSATEVLEDVRSDLPTLQKAIEARDFQEIVDHYARCSERTRDEKADFGKETHRAVESWLLSGTMGDRTLEVGMVAAQFVSLAQEWGMKLEHLRSSPLAEVTGFNRTAKPSGYAGTIDAIVRLPDGWRGALDIKTGSESRERHQMQLAAYLHFEELQLGMTEWAPMPELDGAILVYINQERTKAKAVTFTREDLEPAWRRFVGTLFATRQPSASMRTAKKAPIKEAA